MQVSDIEWAHTCCGEACRYAEVETADGWLQIKTSHDDADLTYRIRKYGKDKMPLGDYAEMTESQLASLLP